MRFFYNKSGRIIIRAVSLLALLVLIVQLNLTSAQNDNNRTWANASANNQIKIDLGYNYDSIYDENNDGVETIRGVIDFSVNAEFYKDVKQENLCTRWSIFSEDSGNKDTICYGADICCNFIDLAPSGANWSQVFYSTYGQYGAVDDNIISAQVIYVDYNLSVENPYTKIYYSDWANLSANYIQSDIENIITKFANTLIDKISNLGGSIIRISSYLVDIYDDPLPNQKISLYLNETLLDAEFTDLLGNVEFELNATSIVPGNYLLNVTFPGQTTVIMQETVQYMPSFEVSIIDIGPSNVTAIQKSEAVQGKAEIGKEVEWTQTIKVINNESNARKIAINLTLPKEAEDVIIKDKKNNKSVSEPQIKPQTSVDAEKTIEFNEQLNPKEEKEFEAKYHTAAPQKIETDETVAGGKITKNVTIKSDASVHYKEVLSYADITDVREEQVHLYWIVDGEKVDVVNIPEFNVTFYDTNENGLVDRVSWIVPQLSEQQFVIEIIIITKAMHLDENKEIISDIYDEVKSKDNVWSEPIYNDEYVRVTFEQELTSSNDITIYARNNQGLNTYIEVYHFNSSDKITQFPIIGQEKYYKILLTGMDGVHDTFDLKIANDDNETAYLELDHIVDPACTVVDDSMTAHGAKKYNTTEQFNVSVQFTCQSGGGTRTAHFDLSLDYGTNTSAATSQATTNLTPSCTTGQNFKFVRAEFAGSCNNLANIACTDANSDGTITIDITNDPVTATVNWTVEVCSGVRSRGYDLDVKATSITDGSLTFNNFVEIAVNNNDSVKPSINASIFNVSSPVKGDVVNFTANATDNGALDTCRFFMNGTSDGSFVLINKSITSNASQCSQNFTIGLTRGNVINFTALVNDTANNINQSEQIITVANIPAPQATVIFPANDSRTNLQPLDLNVTFANDPDGDVINISYYIDGKLNQTSLGNVTLNASDGIYILNISLFDNVSGANPSANVTINFTIDTVKPAVNLSSPADIFNSSTANVTFIFNVSDERSSININCSIYIDSILNITNSSTVNATPTSFQIDNFDEGAFFWNITCLDEAGNTNTSETRNFTIDLIPPSGFVLNFTPNSTDDVDPDVLLNFTINATENTSVTTNVSEIKTVVLQFKQSGAGTFTNTSARLDGDGLYYANFTPDLADTWNYRVYSEDHAGNNDTSETRNISVENDRTWKRNPGTFNNIACVLSQTCDTGNITINNTGDFTLNFDLSSNFGSTSFNVTEPFDLAAKASEDVKVSLTAGATPSESNVVITIDATTSNADPDSETTNFTFTSSAGGPVFDLKFINPPAEVNRSKGEAVYLNASLKNIGNETAGISWINWSLPENWVNITGTNLTKNISNLSVNEVVHHNITINLTTSATTGTKIVNISSSSNNSATDNATASIVVTETSTVTVEEESTTTAGGGGGGGGGTGGGGGSAPVILKLEEINISQIVDLVRGRESSFKIKVSNSFKDSLLVNLTLQVDGFLSQYLTVTPRLIENLRYNQTKEFVVTVAAPPYKGYEEHVLNATVTGLAVKVEKIGNVTTTVRSQFLLKNFISLIIHEISKEDANASIIESLRLIEEMQNAGFPVKKASVLLDEAKIKLSSRRYQLAQEISVQIKNIRDNAFAADSLIRGIRSKIVNAENKGLKVEETKRLMSLALAAFEREDFETSIARAKDAQLSIVIETKGKFNVVRFIIDYWYPIILGILILISLGYFLRKQLTLIIISRRLDDLQKEEVTLHELMEETQQKYYNEKKINTTEYHKAMYGYEKRSSEVTQLISRLRSRRVGIIEISNEIKNLKKEDESVVNLIKSLQDGYYNKQTVNRKVYQKRIKEYKLRRIELERSIAVFEAKLAKKEKLAELLKETPEKGKQKKRGFNLKNLFKRKATGDLNIAEAGNAKKTLLNLQAEEQKEDTHAYEAALLQEKGRGEEKKDDSGKINSLINKLMEKKDSQVQKWTRHTQNTDIPGADASNGNLVKKSKEKNVKEITKRPISLVSSKKQIISHLKDKFNLDENSPKPRIISKSTGNKHSVLRHLKEVHKHG